MAVVDQRMVDTVEPPAGWVWRVRNNTFNVALKDYNDPDIPGRIQLLWKWAKEHKVGLIPIESVYVSTSYLDANVWGYFTVTAEPRDRKKFFGFGKFDAPCGHKHRVGEWFCKQPGNRLGGVVLSCRSCYNAGVKLFAVDKAAGHYMCAKCAHVCEEVGCNEWLYTAKRSRYVGDAANKCDTHCPNFKCMGCQKVHPDKDGKHLIKHGAKEVLLCSECKVEQICTKCHKWEGKKCTEVDGKRLCTVCTDKLADAEREKNEKWEEGELPKHGKLLIPSLPNRPVRVVSIETEVDGDSQYLGKTLYNCGIVRVPEIESYGTYTPENTEWAAFLKYDGSVTGGELISFLLQLDKATHADAFLDVLSKLRSLQKVGKVAYNSNCGGHIHIDAHNFDSHNIWRLLTVWNYLEDVIYRLAGSGHKYGHRTQDPKHDRANAGRGYAKSPAKGPWGVKSNVRRAIEGQDRMCGLNFQPYIQAVRNCRCDAAARDDMRSCTCTLPKCTIEWRVWNSTGQPRILHAWLAFMQALHAYADVDEEPTKEFEDKFPVFAWTGKAFSDVRLTEQKKIKERLEWIFANLVLTDDERDSLIYAIQQSDMKGLGDEYIEGLREIPASEGEARPKPRNATVRQKSIVIKAPKPGDNPLGNLSPGDRERLEYQRRRVMMRRG